MEEKDVFLVKIISSFTSKRDKSVLFHILTSRKPHRLMEGALAGGQKIKF